MSSVPLKQYFETENITSQDRTIHTWFIVTIGELLERQLNYQVKPEVVMITVVRTQDPHHPCVCGARLVIAHPLKNYLDSL